MASDKCVYIIDSSSWLRIREHPNSNQILDALTTLLEDGRVKSPPEVFEELTSIDAVTVWVKSNKKDIVDNRTTDIQYLMRVGEVASAFPGMTGVRGRKNKADPYVVALASVRLTSPASCSVVCDETIAKRPNRKLPTACAAFGVEALGIFEMLKKEFPDQDW